MGKSDSTHIKSENGRVEQHGTNQVTRQVVGQTGAMSNPCEVFRATAEQHTLYKNQMQYTFEYTLCNIRIISATARYLNFWIFTYYIPN